MVRKFRKYFVLVYWVVLCFMIICSVVSSFALSKSDDVRVYLKLRHVVPYNTNWVRVLRDRLTPDLTMILVNVPGTSDKAHMRLIAYRTADLHPYDSHTLKTRIQSYSEASLKGDPVSGEIIDMEPGKAKQLYTDTSMDMVLYGLVMMSIPEALFLGATIAFLVLKRHAKGEKNRGLFIFSKWVGISYFLSFASMCAALYQMSFPVMPVIYTLLS